MPQSQSFRSLYWGLPKATTLLCVCCIDVQGQTLPLGKVGNCLGPQLKGPLTTIDLLLYLDMKNIELCCFLTHYTPKWLTKTPKALQKYAPTSTSEENIVPLHLPDRWMSNKKWLTIIYLTSQHYIKWLELKASTLSTLCWQYLSSLLSKTLNAGFYSIFTVRYE